MTGPGIICQEPQRTGGKDLKREKKVRRKEADVVAAAVEVSSSGANAQYN